MGAFYDKATLKRLGLQVPTTFDLVPAGAWAVAKPKGVPPIMVGNLDRWPMGHVFMVLQARFDQACAISKLDVRPRRRHRSTPPAPARRPRCWQQWSDKGYFEDGYNGVSQENAAARFGKGEGLYFITGPWENQTFAGPLGDGVGFFPLPSLDGTPGAPTSGFAVAAVPHQPLLPKPGRGGGVHQLHHRPGTRPKVVIPQRRPAGREPGGGGGRSQVVAGRDLATAWGEKAQGGHAHALPGLGHPHDGRHPVRRAAAAEREPQMPADFAAAVQQDWVKTHS